MINLLNSVALSAEVCIASSPDLLDTTKKSAPYYDNESKKAALLRAVNENDDGEVIRFVVIVTPRNLRETLPKGDHCVSLCLGYQKTLPGSATLSQGLARSRGRRFVEMNF